MLPFRGCSLINKRGVLSVRLQLQLYEGKGGWTRSIFHCASTSRYCTVIAIRSRPHTITPRDTSILFLSSSRRAEGCDLVRRHLPLFSPFPRAEEFSGEHSEKSFEGILKVHPQAQTDGQLAPIILALRSILPLMID